MATLYIWKTLNHFDKVSHNGQISEDWQKNLESITSQNFLHAEKTQAIYLVKEERMVSYEVRCEELDSRHIERLMGKPVC